MTEVFTVTDQVSHSTLFLLKQLQEFLFQCLLHEFQCHLLLLFVIPGIWLCLQDCVPRD